MHAMSAMAEEFFQNAIYIWYVGNITCVYAVYVGEFACHSLCLTWSVCGKRMSLQITCQTCNSQAI